VSLRLYELSGSCPASGSGALALSTGQYQCLTGSITLLEHEEHQLLEAIQTGVARLRGVGWSRRYLRVQREIVHRAGLSDRSGLRS
jgi:hypothetical protein